MQPWPPIDAAMAGVDHSQAVHESAILDLPRGRQSSSPRIKSTPTHTETAAQDRQGVLGLLRGDEMKLHSLCLAKKAVAFFKISRSVRSSRFSLRNRRNSVRSSSVSGISGFGRLAWIHVRNVAAVIPRSRAIARTDSSEFRARRTASARNSGE